jgi:hypothetical protein
MRFREEALAVLAKRDTSCRRALAKVVNEVSDAVVGMGPVEFLLKSSAVTEGLLSKRSCREGLIAWSGALLRSDARARCALMGFYCPHRCRGIAAKPRIIGVSARHATRDAVRMPRRPGSARIASTCRAHAERMGGVPSRRFPHWASTR